VSRLPADLGDGALLRRLTLEDLDELWDLVQRERDRLAVWMPWASTLETATIDDEREWLESVSSNPDTLEGCGLFVDGRYVGGVGLMPERWGIAAEIGYWIGSAHEGRGLVTRAVRVLVDVGFEELGLNRIAIRAGVANHRSRGIPERLGFTREGVERGGGRGTGGYYDLVVYSMLRDEWPPTT
jgi:ribosomal-protein-serine acetyltransferase